MFKKLGIKVDNKTTLKDWLENQNDNADSFEKSGKN